MTDKQQVRIDAFGRVKQFCKDHDADLSPLVEYPSEKNDFDVKMKALGIAIINQGQLSGGATADKSALKQIMATTTYQFALRGAVMAHQAGDNNLETNLSHPLTYISQAEDAVAAVRANEIRTLLNNGMTAGTLTNILPGDINDIGNTISAFTAVVTAPSTIIKDRKSSGTDLITPLLDEIDVPKDNIGKLIHSYLPALAHDWDVAAKVGAAHGIRHLRIVVYYTDFETGVPLKHVKGTLTNGSDTFIKYSTELGYIRGKDMDNGNYTLTSEFPGYTTDVHTAIGIEADKIVKLEIKLHKI